MDAVEVVKVAGAVIAALGVVATFFWKVFENNQEIRAHSFATRAFALAKTCQGELHRWRRLPLSASASWLRVTRLPSDTSSCCSHAPGKFLGVSGRFIGSTH